MNPIDFILHLDKYLAELIQIFGPATYLILFLIIFAETGLVVAPFLPGDSLLFIVGTFAAKGYLNIAVLFVSLTIAAIIGDSVNYWIGNIFGEKVFLKKNLIKKEHLEKTKKFYEKYGGKTILLARFVPVVRTIAPFVAGVGEMKYKKFFLYNIIGGLVWVTIFLFGGFLFGEIPFVQENLTAVTFAIILVSILPAIIEYLRRR